MKAFIQANPEFAAFAAWAKTAPWTASYAEEPYHGLNSFIFTDAEAATTRCDGRCCPRRSPFRSRRPTSKSAARIFSSRRSRSGSGPPVRNAGPWSRPSPIPATRPRIRARPGRESRRTVQVGTLIVQRIEPERDGPCRDINFDPTVLPQGIRVSDDPFPAARSSVYRKSYDLRAAEARDYPRTEAAKP